MGEEIFIPYGAMYYLSKLLYRTAKRGFLTIRAKNKVKKEIAPFVEKELTMEKLEKTYDMLSFELKSNIEFKKENVTTKKLEEIKETIDLVIWSRVCAEGTPKYKILKKYKRD